LETNRKLSTAKRKLEAAKSAYPLNAANVIACQIDVENLEDGCDRATELYFELFGEVKDNNPVKKSKKKVETTDEQPDK
jgi:hypothetical protein